MLAAWWTHQSGAVAGQPSAPQPSGPIWTSCLSALPIFLGMQGDEEDPSRPHQTQTRQNHIRSDQNGTTPIKLNQTHDQTKPYVLDPIIDI